MLPATGEERTAILVLGMHRSGTSAVTRLLGALGVALPLDPISGSGDNLKGYFESRAVVAADDRLVRALRSSWFDPRPLDPMAMSEEARRAHSADLRGAVATGFGDARLFAMKDPRQCRFVPFLRAALAEAGIGTRAVLVVREPYEVAASLCARDATIPAYGGLLWLRHMLDAERDTRDVPRAIIDYAAVISDWRGEMARLAVLLGDDRGAAEEGDVAAFVDPALRRRRAQDIVIEEPIAGLLSNASRAFAALRDKDGPAERDAMDAVRAALASIPHLEGDIVHDELRHRRVPAVPRASHAPEPAPPPAAPREPAAPDIDRLVAVIRDSGLFDAGYYLERYPEVRDSGMDPIRHYVEIGAPEGRNPSPHFNTAYYARQMARRRSQVEPR